MSKVKSNQIGFLFIQRVRREPTDKDTTKIVKSNTLNQKVSCTPNKYFISSNWIILCIFSELIWSKTNALQECRIGERYWTQREYTGIVFRFTTKPPNNTKGMTKSGNIWTACSAVVNKMPTKDPNIYPHTPSKPVAITKIRQQITKSKIKVQLCL